MANLDIEIRPPCIPDVDDAAEVNRFSLRFAQFGETQLSSTLYFLGKPSIFLLL